MVATRETGLPRLLNFTVVVVAIGCDVYSLFLVFETLSFVVPYNIWHIFLMCVLYFVGM